MHRSSKYMYITLVRSSILLSEDFNLPIHRSSGFRSYLSDLTHFHTCFRFGYATKLLSLATKANSLARFSKRTLQPFVVKLKSSSQL